MFHREIYAGVENALREVSARPFALLDLGCGDAELDFAVAHVRGHDLPERLGDLLGMAERAGLRGTRRLGQYTWRHALRFGRTA